MCAKLHNPGFTLWQWSGSQQLCLAMKNVASISVRHNSLWVGKIICLSCPNWFRFCHYGLVNLASEINPKSLVFKQLFVCPCRCVCACVFAAGQLESRVMDFIFCFLWQWGDLGGLWRRPLVGVKAVKRWEEAEPIGCAHGLFEVTLLIHELLNGVVCFHGAAFNHLNRRERGRRGSFILLFIKMFFFFCKICQLTRNVKTNCRIYIYLFYFENSRMEKVVYVQGYYSADNNSCPL